MCFSSTHTTLLAGPKPITDFSHYISDGVEYISWVNPSNDTSLCYESTAVRVFFNGKEEITYFEDGEESMIKPLCKKGYGEVEVWAEGGDGRSNSSGGAIIYNTSKSFCGIINSSNSGSFLLQFMSHTVELIVIKCCITVCRECNA